MKEMTDRELTDKISQVFDNFEDPTAAYGWQELRKKYPEADKKPVLLWWGAAAAVLTVLCGLWFIVQDTNPEDQSLADLKSQSETTSGKISADKDSAEKAAAEETGSSGSATTQKSGKDRHGNSSPSKSPHYFADVNKPARQIQEFREKMNIAPAKQLGKQESISIPGQITPQILTAGSSLVKDPVLSLPETTAPALNPEMVRDSIVDAAARILALAPQNPSPGNHADQDDEMQDNSRKASKKDHSFSVYAGSYFNYSLGSETKLNFGAGFTSDIKIASNLRLSTGLALAKNSLSYNNGVPSPDKAKRAYDAVPSFGITNAGHANNSLTTVTKYDADLLALDIPINLKYLIIPEDNKLYLLAGLSSGTYLSETYSLGYRNYSAAGVYLNQRQGVEVKNQLQAFDLARTLNISFGYSANLGKSQNITIEPFLKYPLGGLGSENLRFGSTGLNLKLNFSNFKK